MRCRHWMLLLAVVAIGVVGCGGSEDTTTPDDAQSQAGSASEQNAGAPSAEESSPAEAVAQFLEAVRRGNDDEAATMFTPLARQKAAEMNIEVAPRGSDTARFEVGEVKYVNEDLARVQSTWTDLDPDGAFKTDEMAWMLRHEQEGWRVAGMAATVFPGEPPLLLDFENPKETLQKLELLRSEIGRRTETQSSQARRPENPLESFRR